VDSKGGVGLVNSGRGGAVVLMTGLSGARAVVVVAGGLVVVFGGGLVDTKRNSVDVGSDVSMGMDGVLVLKRNVGRGSVVVLGARVVASGVLVVGTTRGVVDVVGLGADVVLISGSSIVNQSHSVGSSVVGSSVDVSHHGGHVPGRIPSPPSGVVTLTVVSAGVGAAVVVVTGGLGGTVQLKLSRYSLKNSSWGSLRSSGCSCMMSTKLSMTEMKAFEKKHPGQGEEGSSAVAIYFNSAAFISWDMPEWPANPQRRKTHRARPLTEPTTRRAMVNRRNDHREERT